MMTLERNYFLRKYTFESKNKKFVFTKELKMNILEKQS